MSDKFDGMDDNINKMILYVGNDCITKVDAFNIVQDWLTELNIVTTPKEQNRLIKSIVDYPKVKFNIISSKDNLI